MRPLWLALALALIGPVAPEAPQDPGNRPTLMLDFVATDRNGAPVANLAPDDLEIWIGHFRVPIARLSYVTPGTERSPGRLIVLLLDDMTLPQALVPKAKIAARRLVTRMGPDDSMAIVTTSGASMRSTNDHARLLSEIDRYNIRANGVVRADVYGEDVLKNIAALAQQVREGGRGGRKTIVAIGNGSLLDRPIPPPTAGRDFAPQWVEAMRDMALAHANLYVIDPSGLAGRMLPGQDGFARATGGRAFLNTNDLERAVDSVLRDSGNYYVVEVPDPPNSGGKGSLRELDVRVKRRDVTVVARRGIP